MNDCFISSSMRRGRMRSRELGAVMGVGLRRETVAGTCREPLKNTRIGVPGTSLKAGYKLLENNCLVYSSSLLPSDSMDFRSGSSSVRWVVKNCTFSADTGSFSAPFAASPPICFSATAEWTIWSSNMVRT